jgi:plastocyanin
MSFFISLLKRTNAAVAISAFVALLAAGCQHGPARSSSISPAQSPSATQRVTVDNFSFNPATLTVAPGTTVTWTNRDDVPHTITANDKRFASKPLDTDDTFSHVFTQAGTYSYFCAVHPHMTGQIIVK